MSATPRNNALRKQAGASIGAVAAEIQHAVRQEMDALRSTINVRLAALDRVLSRDQNDPAFDPIIQKLCEIAAEEARAATTLLRAEVEEAAARDLAAVREQAQADVDAARAQSEATRLELEQRLVRSEAAKVEAALALAEAERAAAAARADVAAARADAEAGVASLQDARHQIDALEGVRAELQLARDIAEAHLEGEIHNRNAIAAELEAAHEEALHAKADADACRLEWQRATERVRVLEERLSQRGADPAVAASSDPGAVLSRVRSALQRVTSAITGRGLFDAALEVLAENFSRAALCAVGPQGFTVWGSRGFDPPLQRRKAISPLTDDSLLARALAGWKIATAKAVDGKAPSGLSGSPIGYALALPIVTKDGCAVMLYAENPPGWTTTDASVGAQIAQILADHLGQRLRPRQAASPEAPPPGSPARQVRRAKIQESINVGVDGAQGTLVDLSTLGAQVLSSRAIRPNRSVQLLLPNANGGLSCEARVVWVLVEQSQDSKSAVYRAGVQFTDVDAPELEAFFSQHRLFEPAIKH